MGQKTHPLGFRLGYTESWRSRWYATKKDFAKLVFEDHQIRKLIHGKHKAAGVPKIEIERTGESVRITIHTARPGVLVGRKGARVDELKTDLEQIVGKGRHVELFIREIKRPEFDSRLVAESIAEQLEKRAAFRRVVKKAIQATMQAGAKGIKIQLGGRLGGAEIARTEKILEGRIPLTTLRAEIDYGTARAETTYGTVGVKVWIFKGEKLPNQEREVPAVRPLVGSSSGNAPSAGSTPAASSPAHASSSTHSSAHSSAHPPATHA
ncbi:MAG: 30S ribosomal protein S3 [Planctomycetes bacterium]|nr:30S ribosomal protein S3 [Planctomycetota bacterium]